MNLDENRLQTAMLSNSGRVYPAGAAISNRGNIAMLDNPFFYTPNPVEDHYRSQKAAGLHFLIFLPTIETFHRVQLTMDRHYPDGKTIRFSPRSRLRWSHAVVSTTHRQNELIPPRNHRCFPRAEFLTDPGSARLHAKCQHV